MTPAEPTAESRQVRSRAAVILRLIMLVVSLGTAIYTGRMLWIGAPDPIRVAVVRFDNETGGPDFDQFAAGLTDLVVAHLTESTRGRAEVIGNAAMLRQPRERRDLKAIGSALRAQYVVLGEVQREDAKVRVLAHLMRLPEQTSVSEWRNEFEGKNPPPNPDRTARDIVAQFAGSLISAPPPRN